MCFIEIKIILCYDIIVSVLNDATQHEIIHDIL